jgi:hypothetical protein
MRIQYNQQEITTRKSGLNKMEGQVILTKKRAGKDHRAAV